MLRSVLRLSVLIVCAASLTATARAAVVVSPAAVELDSPESTQQILVSRQDGARLIDVTRSVTYTSANPKVAAADGQGLIIPQGEGQTEILVQSGSDMAKVPVVVRNYRNPVPISFEHQIIPILTKAGCNMGGCHGKAEGQNGFKLSVFGYDPPSDFAAITMEGRGRRVSASDPTHSLFLRKGTAGMPHGGGRKLEPGSLWQQRIQRWIAEGTPAESPSVAPVVRIEVEPEQVVMLAKGTQQLRVTAIDATGKRHCVTSEAEFSSNAEQIAGVDRRGWVQTSDTPGEAAILVRYMGLVNHARITMPRPGVKVVRPPENNFIDKLVWDKLDRLGIQPSDLSTDAMFMRRVYLDTIGTLPTTEETRKFLADKDPNKRDKLIDHLFERDEYADFWTMKWADILRVDRNAITAQGNVAMTRWLHKQFDENRPYDQMVREILTAQGNVAEEGPTSFYQVLKTPEELSRSVSQLFLGVRIECAQCHHHPFERWGQDDYFAFGGFFTGVSKKPLPSGTEAVFASLGSDLKNPRTGMVQQARGLGSPPADFSKSLDRRQELATWLTAPQNPFFARAITNRLWAHYMGRGLVEPVDDLRATNPASNEPLFAALAQHLRDSKYDLKAFTRTILKSRVYQLSSITNKSNIADMQNFSHAMFKSMPAEVLLDAISQSTGVPEKFEAWPEGYRAIQIWDNRMASYFFRIFGRPVRASVCECERSNEPSVSQALHLMNSPALTNKLRDKKGLVRRLAASDMAPEAAFDELALASVNRKLSPKEQALFKEVFIALKQDRRAAFEDVLWSLMNTKEFMYNH